MNSETCEFYVTTWDDPPQTLFGKVFLENGKIRFWAKKEHEDFMKATREQKTFALGCSFDPVKDPEGWFRSLRFQYSGGMVRAQIVKTRGRKKERWFRIWGKGHEARKRRVAGCGHGGRRNSKKVKLAPPED